MEDFKTGKVAEGTKPCLLFAGETFADTTNLGRESRESPDKDSSGGGGYEALPSLCRGNICRHNQPRKNSFLIICFLICL